MGEAVRNTGYIYENAPANRVSLFESDLQNWVSFLAFFQEFFQGAKSTVMQLSIAMLIFLLLSDKILKGGGQSL